MSGAQLIGKIALITGAAQGQGAAEARWFAEQGASVLVADVMDDIGNALVDELRADGHDVAYRRLDVTLEQDWADALDSCLDRWGGLDALVNNAGIAERSGVEDISLDRWQAVMAVNLTGALLGMRAASDALGRRGGAVVNVSSVAGLAAYPGAAYAASKWGLRGLTKTAAVELAPRGVRVNSIHPGFIETGMVSTAPVGFVEGFIGTTPLGRAGHVDDVAPLVGFLCSDASSFITGAEIAVDGGWSVGGQLLGVQHVASAHQRSLDSKWAP